MNRLFLALAFMVSPIFGATITGPIGDLTGGAYSPRVEFWPQSTPFFSGTTAIVGPMKSVAVTNGNFYTTLVSGRYYCKFPPTTNGFTIYVPTGSATYTLSQVATNVFVVVDYGTAAISNNDTRSLTLTNIALGHTNGGIVRTTNLIQRVVNPADGSGVTGQRLGSGVLWQESGGGSIFGFGQSSFNVYTNFFAEGTHLTGTLTNSITGNAAGATNLVGNYLDDYVGIYFNNLEEKLIVTRGSFKGQQQIFGPYTSPASASFRDGSLLRTNNLWYVGHTLNSFNETNKFGIIQSADLQNWTTTYIYDCASVSNVFGNNPVKQVWGPKWFVDSDGSIYLSVGISTNTGSTSMRAFITRATDLTFTNWTSLVMLTNALDVSNFDSTLVKSNSGYQCWTRNVTGYNEVYTATNIYGPWSAYKTADWAGWGVLVEGIWVERKPDGNWRLNMADPVDGGGLYATTTNDNFSTWTALKRRPDSQRFANGSLFPINGEAIPGNSVFAYANGSNATTGQRFYVGNPVKNPSIGHSFFINGGVDAWLAMKGSTSSGIAYDPDAVGNADFYIADYAGHVAGTAMKIPKGTQNIYCYGSFLGKAGSASVASFAQDGDLDTGLFFVVPNSVSVTVGGLESTRWFGASSYQSASGGNGWANGALGGTTDTATYRKQAGELAVGSDILATTYRDLYVRAVTATNAVATALILTNTTTVTLTADNQVVGATTNSFLLMASDNVTAANRTFLLTTGVNGKLLTLVWTGTNAGELVDDSANSGSGNVRLSATWTPTQYDVLNLIGVGNDWYEVSRSTN